MGISSARLLHWTALSFSLSLVGSCTSSESAPASGGQAGSGVPNSGASAVSFAGQSSSGAPSAHGGTSASAGNAGASAAGTMNVAGAAGTMNVAGAAGASAHPGSAGCQKSSVKTGSSTSMLNVASKMRSYDLWVSSGYDGKVPVPLSIAFHGAGGNSQAASAFGLQQAAAATGDSAVFAFPQGIEQGTQGVGWDLACNGEDVAFYDALVKQLEADYCVDPRRVFVEGFSWGGDMVNTLACCRGDAIRAAVPISGALYLSASGCTAKTPAFRLTSGTADPYYQQDEFTRGLLHAQSSNHCSGPLSAVSPSPCQAYSGCDQPVIWCSYEGMGHALPEHWAEETWAFLRGLP